jgi:hypothetical protein
LLQRGYVIEQNPALLNVRALLYASSPKLTSVGLIKFFNHYLFLDWQNDLFGRLEVLKETHSNFSKYVNQQFHVAQAWRMTLPNLAVVAISQQSFAPDVTNYVKNTYKNPWYGGETGQFMLINLKTSELISHTPPRFKELGSIPLVYAVDEIGAVIAVA